MGIRVVTGFGGDAQSFLSVPAIAFAEPDSDEMRAMAEILDEERSHSAVDGDRIVGAITSLDFDLTVPGATVPASGVSWVGVLPTDRRRGALAALMRAELEATRARGEPVACLWASESSIYGRFGYGPAADVARWSIERPFTALRGGLPEGPRISLTRAPEAIAVARQVHEAVRPSRPGFVTQTRAHHEFRLADFGSRRRHASPLFFAVADDGTGYTAYRCRVSRDGWLPSGELVVAELVADRTATEVALWRYLFGVDLMARITADARPADDPLVHMLADPRRLERVVHDGLWLRLVDVAEALARRSYPCDGALRFEVDDAFLGWNAGTLELEVNSAVATCAATSLPPHLRLDAETLASLYLGGTRPTVMARAGRIEELSTGALATAERLFAWSEPPWCATMF